MPADFIFTQAADHDRAAGVPQKYGEKCVAVLHRMMEQAASVCATVASAAPGESISDPVHAAAATRAVGAISEAPLGIPGLVRLLQWAVDVPTIQVDIYVAVAAKFSLHNSVMILVKFLLRSCPSSSVPELLANPASLGAIFDTAKLLRPGIMPSGTAVRTEMLCCIGILAA